MTYLFNTLFFIVPLIFNPKTSEVFEFNKMLTLYLFTVLITGLWVTKMIKGKRFIFKKTILDLPIILFLLSQVISTVFSIDQRTSLLGYYSRLNGGLLSSFSYALLYWAVAANLNLSEKKNVIKSLLFSGVIVSLWGISEHFGASPSCLIITKHLNTSCFVQDVQARVFATLGQPNWMAAWLVAIMSLAWAEGILQKETIKKFGYLLISFLYLTALLFTKSRSGFLGFGVTFTIFWVVVFFIFKKRLGKISTNFVVFLGVALVTILIIGSPFFFGSSKSER